MRVAARRGMWGFRVALLIAACGEPGQGAATGPAPVVDPAAEVAILAVVEGRVTVRNAQGGETEARAEMPLTRGDTVVTTPGSLAVVVLANGYVLKLEEDQATPVRALAHLDDPRRPRARPSCSRRPSAPRRSPASAGPAGSSGSPAGTPAAPRARPRRR